MGEDIVQELKDALLEVRQLSVKPGDVLHVKVGGYIGDGQPDYIPGPEDLDRIKEEVESVLPEGVTAYVTHHLVDIATVVSTDGR